jgi:hypothetical protein
VTDRSLSYPAARELANRLSARFATDGVADTEPPPDPRAIEDVVSAAFWASLRREEGRAPKISIALMPPERAAWPIVFDPPLRLEPDELARLAPAVERPGIHMGVWDRGDGLVVWGTSRTVPAGCFVLEVVAPGLLVVKTPRSERSAKFSNVAVLEGADVKFVDHHGAAALDAEPALGPLGAFYSSAGSEDPDNLFVQLAVSMRRHAHGGMLLVVPSDSDQWKASIVQPITYPVVPCPSEMEELVEAYQLESVRVAVDALAGLTAVDGATIITDTFRLLAFGAKIARRQGAKPIEQVLLTEPIQGAANHTVEPSLIGGTRHLSAAQFVHDQRDALALVASQDGRFTVFAWSPVQDMVHAHRLEVLLL